MKSTNYRFWTWWRDGWVKLTVRPGHPVTAHSFCRHEEGWSSRTETFEHTPEGLRCIATDDGRDCDGRLQTTFVHEAPASELASVPVQPPVVWDDKAPPVYGPGDYDHRGHLIHRPKWRAVNSPEVFDEYAQAAGY